jgi:hypothetical protein
MFFSYRAAQSHVDELWTACALLLEPAPDNDPPLDFRSLGTVWLPLFVPCSPQAEISIPVQPIQYCATLLPGAPSIVPSPPGRQVCCIKSQFNDAV